MPYFRHVAIKWQDVGDYLREQRRIRGWSQRDLSDESGVSEVTVRMFEQGVNADGTPANPRLSTAIKVARALGSDGATFLTLLDEPEAAERLETKPVTRTTHQLTDEEWEELKAQIDEVARIVERLDPRRNQ